MRKLDIDCHQFRFKYQQANRLVIQKILMVKGNEILFKRNEECNRPREWVAMAMVANLCKIVDKRRKKIKAYLDKIAKQDKMARRLQGFFLRVMYKKSLTVRQLRKKNCDKLLPAHAFKLTKDRDSDFVNKFRKACKRMTNQLVLR